MKYFLYLCTLNVIFAMSKPIEHIGVVEEVQGNRVLVRFVQQTACAGCQARSMCMSSESKEKQVWAYVSEPMEKGEKVLVQVAERLAWRAVALAYGLPLVVMMVALCVMKVWLSDAVAGTITLVALSVYYIILSMFKDGLNKSFDFWAKRVEG